ncbi:hypothetical protein EDC04DRAFT_2601218 [Pisolithus marmoratus]|nr:hypothetical protein EDC04DRAFT_2601218 [Pisolithus marmoratus]
MSHVKPSPNLPVKIGPPISVQRSQRIKGNTMPPTEVQPVKSHHQRIKGMTDEECEQQYLNSFHTKMVILSNGQQLHPHVALQQLCAGVISKEDIVQDDDSDEGKNIPESSPTPSVDEHTPPDGDMDSETKEQVVKDAMEPVDEGNSVMDDQGNKQSGMNSNHITILQSSTPDGSIQHEGSTESSDEHSDWSTDKRHSLKLEQTRLPPGQWTKEAQVIADKYGKMLISIMTAAGLTTKATQVESVWNTHQAWYVHTNPKASGEHMKDYYSHQTKHYEDHKDEEEFPQLWAEIHMFWSKSISGSKDTSSKAMVQTWCNVEGIHVFGCVIYSGSDEAAHQAQGISTGSTLCMQLAGEKQTDISKQLDYLATIVKYRVLDSAALVPLPNFTVLSQAPYDCTLALKPQESRCDHNCHILPVVFMHKLYEANLVGGQRNVPWKTLLDVLYAAQYTVVDWPAMSLLCLNADELHGLVVPFLKEQMGADYHAEAPGEDQDQDGSMVVPSSSSDLKKWTSEQILRHSSECFQEVYFLPRSHCSPHNQTPHLYHEVRSYHSCLQGDIYNWPPIIIFHSILPMYSTATVILPHHTLSIMHANITGNISSTRVIMMHPHHREGTIIVLLNMYIKTVPTSGAMAMIWMMKTIIDIITMQATKYPDDTATVGF